MDEIAPPGAQQQRRCDGPEREAKRDDQQVVDDHRQHLAERVLAAHAQPVHRLVGMMDGVDRPKGAGVLGTVAPIGGKVDQQDASDHRNRAGQRGPEGHQHIGTRDQRGSSHDRNAHQRHDNGGIGQEQRQIGDDLRPRAAQRADQRIALGGDGERGEQQRQRRKASDVAFEAFEDGIDHAGGIAGQPPRKRKPAATSGVRSRPATRGKARSARRCSPAPHGGRARGWRRGTPGRVTS